MYATNVELVEAPGYERTKVAESLWYLYHDLSDNAREQGFFPSLQEVRSVGFPAETAELAEKLNDSQFRAGLKAEYQNFLQAHNEDSSLLRFHYHKLERLAQRLDELDLPLREYQSSMTMPPLVRQFITDDEINESLSGGSGFSGGKAVFMSIGRKTFCKRKSGLFEKSMGQAVVLMRFPVLLAVVKITMPKESDTPKAAVIRCSCPGHRLPIALIR